MVKCRILDRGVFGSGDFPAYSERIQNPEIARGSAKYHMVLLNMANTMKMCLSERPRVFKEVKLRDFALFLIRLKLWILLAHYNIKGFVDFLYNVCNSTHTVQYIIMWKILIICFPFVQS